MGVEPNEIESVKWFRRAASKGFRRAQYRLGQAYRKGLGVPVDQKRAMKWFWDAARQGDVPAYYRLGRAYQVGEGTTKDLVEALRWFLLAASKKGPLQKAAIHRTDVIVAILSKAQIDDARQRAATWRPSRGK